MKLDQCLFGYDDGHRLLSSSLPLGAEASLLTEISDLAPGTVFSQSDGYWTGLPAPSIGRYVLMRTWPAPEMSRPGCVWTHALLIEPSLLESIEDLGVLQALAVRPSPHVDKDMYRDMLQVDLSALQRADLPVDNAIVRKLLATLYASKGSTVEVTSPGQLDGPLFAVWSQQWPRLRRNFRFQTAASRLPRTSGSVRFDITAVLASQGTDNHYTDTPNTQWLSAAEFDIQEGANGPLRRFLWQYGRDVRKQRGSFRPLVEIKAIDDESLVLSDRSVIATVTSAFPLLEDALRLKQDLVDGELVPLSQAGLITSVLLKEGVTTFPLPTNKGIARLERLWPKKLDELLALAEGTAGAESNVEKLVFETVTKLISKEEFWNLTAAYPKVRNHMLRENSSLLMEPSALELDSQTLIDLLPLTPEKTDGLDRLVFGLIARDDDLLSSTVFKLFPNTAVAQTILAANDNKVRLTSSWWRELIRRPAVLLQPDLMQFVSRTSLLHCIADSLGWLTSEVMAAGTKPWAAALACAKNDLSEEHDGTFCSFLLTLALTSGDAGGPRMIKQTFDTVHSQALKSGLSQQAQEILSPFLPDVGWFKGWDLGLRIRVAVVQAFVRFDWSPRSFAELSNNRKAREMLSGAASDVPGGKRYEFFK